MKNLENRDECNVNDSDRTSISCLIRTLLSQVSEPMDVPSITQSLNKLYEYRRFTSKQVVQTTYELTQQSNDIFLWEHGKVYVHRKNMNITAPLLEIIEDDIIQTLRSGSVQPLALYAIFEQYRDACILDGIPSTFALHACLKARSHAGISFVRSPNVCQPGKERKREHIKTLEKWAADKRDYFSKKEMANFAHEKMGITRERFHLLFSNLNSVIPYYDNLFVHINSLEWNEDKKSCFEIAALVHWDERLTRGALFARTDQLLEEKRNDMPVLPDALAWSGTLAYSLLARSEEFDIFGNTDLCYGFRAEPLTSWGSIIEQVLRTQFGGGASLRDFSDYLRNELRLIRARLTPAMLAQCPNIYFSEHEIYVTEGGSGAA